MISGRVNSTRNNASRSVRSTNIKSRFGPLRVSTPSSSTRISTPRIPRVSSASKKKATKFAKTMKAGRTFQKRVNKELMKRHDKVYSEVYVQGKKSHNARIDHLVDSKKLQPYSTKNSRWHKVQATTWKKYVREAAKYPDRTILTNKPGYTHLKGRKVGKNPVLVMPKRYLKKDTQARLQEIKTYASKRRVRIELQ
ncbi:hypothetical protein [Chloroflexus aggregans]|uniref:Uncharacterized protein n=1 Tax=Chloroflexus aggregans (strain MD-66 / DSM 9485) TaxID=326427 RepID=B8G746_CHLAD|nr:hypothetical protein [Chloroflexus aggregans]ACL24003.1 hypothetical protein Cagg_1090 [Chloroflexus aggregans DSM 9485]